MKRNRLQRSNIDKQEAVVTALWEFASDMQFRKEEGILITSSDGTVVSDKHIRSVMQKIMGTFGYRILEVQ